jgi:autotransporter-associated beta strand protein
MNIKITFLLILSFINLNAQNTLTISTTGQTGTSGTNWSLSSNVLTITGIADVNASVISGHLASNNLSLSGVANISVNAAISWSSNTTLTLNASGNILISRDITASGSSPQLYIYHGGSNATTAPSVSATYALSQRNRNKINFSSSSAVFRVGNETYTVCTNLSQLSQAMSNATSSTRVALGASISLSQTYSNSLFPINFSGKFDGLGQVIDGLRIRNSGGVGVKADLGLFSQLQGATIRNIGITNVDIITNSTAAGTTGSEFRIGALAGNIGNSSLTTTGYSATAYTTIIESVWSSGNIRTANNFTTDGQSSGDRQKFFFAGGMVGSINNGTANISRCYSYTNVSSSGSYTDNFALGGIIGDAGINISLPRPHTFGNNSHLIVNINRTFSTGSVLSGTFNATNISYYGTGGIIGVMFVSGSSLTNCYSWGSAISSASFGGITGYSDGVSISNSYTTQTSLGNINNNPASIPTNLYSSVTSSSPSTGTTLPSGFSSSVWSKATTERPVLLDLETPPTILYVRVTSGQSSPCGNVSINYTITNATGSAVTLSSLGLNTPTGTPAFTINNLTPPGSYSSVSYLSGLTLTGANAANYTLNPYPETSPSHTITGTCTNYQITFDGNTNTSGTTPANIVFTNSTTIPDQGSLVKTGSTFLGWNTAANGSGTSYAAGAIYSGTSNLTLFAQWVSISSLGCVNIVLSGGAAENSGWVANYNTIRPSSSTAVNINASDIVSKLGSGNVKIMGNCITISTPISYTTNTKSLELESNTTIFQDGPIVLSGPVTMTGGGNITINRNINTSTGNANGDVLLKSAGDISISSNRSIITNGGDVIIWANSDGNATSTASDGSIVINHSSNITTSGGHLWMGGGSGNASWNGLTVGNGYAVAGSQISVGTGSNFTSGICIMRSNINTNGGDIFIGGQNNKTDFTASLVNYGTTTIDAGAGKIKIEGRSSLAATSSFITGMHHGLGGVSLANLTIRSSHNTSANNAIEIDVNNVSNVATIIEGNTLIQSTGAGKILFTSTSTGSGAGIDLGYSIGNFDVLSSTGDITLNTANSGFNIFVGNSTSTLGFKEGSSVTSSTANIRIISNLINTVGILNNNTTGTLRIEPVAGSSFSSALNTTQIRYSSGITGLIIGHATNTSNLTIGSATSINGPIEVYGGTISLSGNLTTTNTTTRDIVVSCNSISGNGNIAIANGRTATLSIVNPATYNGIISGIGSNFIKQGAGNLTLTGANSYNGTTTMSAGNIQIGNGDTTGTIGTGNITNNTSLIYNRTNDYTIPGLISGTGSLTKQGTGTLTLTQNNTYSGSNTISTGTLVLQNNAPNPSNKVFNGTGQLRIEPSSTSFTSSFSNSGWTFNSTLTGLTIGKTENTTNVTMDAATTIAGPITVFGGVVSANANITTSNASSISLLAKSGLRFSASSITLQTGGGAVVLSGDHDANSSGNIIAEGALTITTNGGGISMGGGAMGSDFAYGIGTSSTIANDQTAGIWVRGAVNLNSGNGNISIRGYAANASPTVQHIPTWGVGLGLGAALNTNPASVTINSGTGTILIEGFARNPSGSNSNSYGVVFNNWETTTTESLTITSANTTANAIRLIGNTENTLQGQRTKNSLRFWSVNNNIRATGTGGGITLSGKTFDGNDHPQICWSGGNLLATSGPIVINTENEALEIGNDMNVGSRSGIAGNTASSANIRFSIDDFTTASGIVRIASIGSLTIEPFGNSFTDYTPTINTLQGFTTATRWSLNENAQTLTGLTLGKSTNTSNITFGSITTIAGPITAFGGTIAVNENITSSNGSTISLFGNALTFGANKTVTSNNGQLIIAPQSVSNTIGLGGAAGTLSLPSSYFSTNFSDGFSNIQIGSNTQTGAISSNAFTLRDNLTLLTSGSLTLGGKPMLGSNNVTLGSEITTINVGSPANYFQTNGSGTVRRNIANNSNLSFPIGNAMNNPISIHNKTASSDLFGARVIDSVSLNGVSGTLITTPHVKATWDISKTNANTGSGIDMTFSWDPSQEVGSISNFKLNHHDGSRWEIAAGTSGSVSGTTTKTITHSGYNGAFSPFAFGQGIYALPVELSKFKASCQSEYIQINWTTASEIRNKAFELFKSDDAQDWKLIYTTDGQGDKATETHYQFNDLDKKIGYYRLKDIDEDGIENWSSIIFADCKNDVSDIQIYPNPATDYIKVIAPIYENTTLNIISLEGKIIKTMPLISNQTLISVKELTEGIYFIEIKGNHNNSLLKFTKN